MEKAGINGILIALIVLLSEETGVPISEISSDTRIEDLGIDSLDFIDLMLKIGEKFKPIPEDKFAAINTVGDIKRLLSA